MSDICQQADGNWRRLATRWRQHPFNFEASVTETSYSGQRDTTTTTTTTTTNNNNSNSNKYGCGSLVFSILSI